MVFTANSGHEFGHLGLDDFGARRPGWERPGGATWVHYGANIGAVGGELSVQSASEDLAALAAQELTRDGCAPDRIAPPESGPVRRDARHPPRRRTLSDFGREQPSISSAAGPLAARRRCRDGRTNCGCRRPAGGIAYALEGKKRPTPRGVGLGRDLRRRLLVVVHVAHAVVVRHSRRGLLLWLVGDHRFGRHQQTRH